MNYRFLTSDDFPLIHRAYIEAFVDYALKIEPTEDQLLRVLMRNAIRWDISSGVFIGDAMIGFTANGFDDWEGEPTAYDSGTGVVPHHRRRGVAYKLFEFMFPRFREAGVRQYLLEVIETNEPALNLYRKLGFTETRSLELFSLDQSAHVAYQKQPPDGLMISEIKEPDWQLLQSFWSYKPSWPNSINAIKRSMFNKLLFGAYLGAECVGYGIVSLSSSDIPQLAVAPQHRRRGIGSALFRTMCSRLEPGSTVSMNNIESSSTETLAFCSAQGFKRIIGQIEMLMKL